MNGSKVNLARLRVEFFIPLTLLASTEPKLNLVLLYLPDRKRQREAASDAGPRQRAFHHAFVSANLDLSAGMLLRDARGEMFGDAFDCGIAIEQIAAGRGQFQRETSFLRQIFKTAAAINCAGNAVADRAQINIAPAFGPRYFFGVIALAIDADFDSGAMTMRDALALPGVFFQTVRVVIKRAVDFFLPQPETNFGDISRHHSGQMRQQVVSQRISIDLRAIEQTHRHFWREMFDRSGCGAAKP